MTPLVFRWPERSSSLLLPAFFALAVAVHAMAFYLFQVVYPPTASIAPPPAHVTLLTPATAENRALLSWLEHQAPRPVVIPGEPSPGIAYTPSYRTGGPPPRSTIAEVATALPWPSGLPPASRRSAPAEPTRPGIASTLRVSESLRPRAASLPATVALAPEQGSRLPTVYLAAVTAEGEISHLFLQSGSGDPALDDAAGKYLRTLSLLKAPGAPLLWGTVTLVWGAGGQTP